MNKLIALVLGFTYSLSSDAQEIALHTSLQKTIDSLAVVDQQVQQDVIMAATAGKTKQEINTLIQKQYDAIKRHKPLVRQILQTHGFPGYSTVGEKSSHNYWLLVQHCDDDPAFQQKVLDQMYQQVKQHNADSRDYAYLVDRVKINTGKPQLYGTQVTYKDGKAAPKELQDSQQVNQRRREVGLKSLEEYLQEMTEAHQQMNATRMGKK